MAKEGKRMESPFVWIPPHERPFKFGPPLKDNIETRIPAFFIDSRIEDSENVVYFINNTAEILFYVQSRSEGFETLDDEVMRIQGPEYLYKDVKQGEAVELEQYSDRMDSDAVFLLSIEVSSTTWGIHSFQVSKKGGVRKGVVMWGTGEDGNMKW